MIRSAQRGRPGREVGEVEVVRQDSESSQIQVFDARTIDRETLGTSKVIRGRTMVFALSVPRVAQLDRVT
jgi:hypothetical protein